ncbi:Spo0E family sporulation regulatory protein-aspartic acid phosphatase [Metabacillus sp. Hm71]
MKGSKQVKRENMNLLLEIYNLKNHLNDLYTKKGPANGEYISFSIKLDLLLKQYIEEKMTILGDELKEMTKNDGYSAT